MKVVAGLFALYILMAFAGMVPSPMLFFAVWLDNRARKQGRSIDWDRL